MDSIGGYMGFMDGWKLIELIKGEVSDTPVFESEHEQNEIIMQEYNQTKGDA